jgi:hypothetical protein
LFISLWILLKNIEDLDMVCDHAGAYASPTYRIYPEIVCHDQEPLDWNYYQQQSLECNFYNQPAAEIDLDQFTPQQLEFEKIKHKYVADFNLKFPIFTLVLACFSVVASLWYFIREFLPKK